MKEIKPDPVHPIQQKTTISRKEKPGVSNYSSGFGQMLEEQIKADQGTKASNPKENGLPELGATFNPGLAGISGISRNMADPITEKITSSIDMLETYAALLADPEIPLKQIHGLLERLEGNTRELDQALESDTPQDLKQVIAHLSSLVRVEQIKFNRGDYLST